MRGYKLIVVIVPKGSSGKVMEKAREAGAEGGTVVLAHGTGVHQARRFFGVSITSERELVLILVEQEQSEGVLNAVVEEGRLNEPTRGIAFMLPVDEVLGIVHKEVGSEE